MKLYSSAMAPSPPGDDHPPATGELPDHGGPLALGDLDRVTGDFRVGQPREELLAHRDASLDALGALAGPLHDHVVGV